MRFPIHDQSETDTTRAALAAPESGTDSNYVTRLETLSDLSQQLVEVQPIERALQLLLDQVSSVIPVAGLELLAVGKNDSLIPLARRYDSDCMSQFDAINGVGNLDSDPERHGSLLANACVRSNEPQLLILRELPEGVKLDPEDDEYALHPETQAALACPVHVDGDVGGVFLLYSKDAEGFDRTARRLALTLASFISNVFQRHFADTERQQSQDVLSRVIDSTGQWIGVIDFNNHIAMANEAYSHHLCQTTGRAIEEIVVDTEFLQRVAAPFVNSEELSASMERWLCSDHRNQGVFMTKAGRQLEFQLIPMLELGHLLIITDVTSEKRQEEAIREANEATAAADQTKSNFLANMSHEIRTPMTAILGFADVLMESELDQEDQQSALQTIQNNGHHLLTVINDILDISSVESGRLQVERADVNLSDVIRSALDLARPLAETKGLDLQLHFDSAAPETIQSDPIRLRQILVNLLSNAVKFTTCGSVSLNVSVGKNEQQKRVVRFRVSDTGVGMNQPQTQRLFQPFSQADDATTRRFGGAGLGLNISRALAQLLGGDLNLVSTSPDVGSVFEAFVDPGELEGVPHIDCLQQEREDPPNDARDATLPPCRILVAEDGVDNQRLIRHMLLRVGAAEVAIAENGLETLERAAEDESFDLVLMDMQMPEMDGYEATRSLRASGFNRPIIALTANAMAEDRAKCLNAGCDDYVTKPIDRERLIYAMRVALDACETESHAGSEASAV